MRSSPREWTVKERQNNFTQKTEETHVTIDTIADVFEDRLTSKPAAEKLATIWQGPLLRQRDDAGGFPAHSLWTNIARSIPALGSDLPGLDRLASMIISLSQQPDVISKDGVVVRGDNDQGPIFWRDLPRLQQYVRGHAFNEIMADSYKPNDMLREQTDRWTNSHMFAAIYLSKLETDVYMGSTSERASMRHLARYCFMRGVETSTEKEDSAQVRRLEAHVPAVVNWILVAGRQILNACRQNLDTEEQSPFPLWLGGDDGGDWLWSGAWGFDLERWMFWKKRFLELAEIAGVGPIRDLCLQAASEMAKLNDSVLSSQNI